jgi:hypothetical protein
MLHLMGLPRRPVFQHGVEDDQQFPHACNECDFLGLAGGAEPLIEIPSRGKVSGVGKGCQESFLDMWRSGVVLEMAVTWGRKRGHSEFLGAWRSSIFLSCFPPSPLNPAPLSPPE